MKCPKCGYISFDYNLTCPKCDKDISSEQEKLNLPAFRPETPALLVALTGEPDESRSMMGGGSGEIDLAHDAEISFEDEPSHFDSNELSLPGSGDFELGSEEISLEDSSGLDFGLGETPKDDLLGSALDTEEAVKDLGLGGGRESEGSVFSTGELELDLPPSGADPLYKESPLDLGETLRLDKAPSRQAKERVVEELQLFGEADSEVDDILNMDEIVLEEIPLDGKPPILHKAEGKKQGAPQDSELSLDLADLDLELDLEDRKPQE
jgi:hypothetical protein